MSNIRWGFWHCNLCGQWYPQLSFHICPTLSKPIGNNEKFIDRGDWNRTDRMLPTSSTERMKCRDCPCMTDLFGNEYTYKWECWVSGETLGAEDQAGCDYLKSHIDREQLCSLTNEQIEELLEMFRGELNARLLSAGVNDE